MAHSRPRLVSATLGSALLLSTVSGLVAAEEAADDEMVAGEVTVYTSVTQDTVDAVLAALE